MPSFSIYPKISDWLRRKVGQIVVVVIDALRADFVLPEPVLEAELGKRKKQRNKMKYLHDLLMKDEQTAFLSRANAPTVTMPRLKVSTNYLPKKDFQRLGEATNFCY